MSFLKYIYTIVFILVICFNKAQTFQFEQLTTKEGLLSDEVYKLHQDKNGYIWLFTNYGAMKYNGKKFETVLRNLPFKESFIYSFYENKKGQKWVANSNGNIYEVVNDSAFIIKGTEIASEKLRNSVGEIYQLYVDDSLNIYVCSTSFSFKYVKNKSYSFISLNTDPFKDSVFHVAIEIDKNTILAAFNGISRDSKKMFESDSVYKIKIVSGKKNSIYKFSLGKDRLCRAHDFKRFKNRIYFTSCSKICFIENDKVHDLVELDSYILFYTKDKNNHLWAGCYNDGVFEFDENDSLINHYFEKMTINHILFDTHNGIWLSSAGFGLFHCKTMNELYFNKKQELGMPICLLKKIGNKIFIGNTDGDIFLLKDNNVLEMINLPPKIKEPLDIIECADFYLIASKSGNAKIYKSDKSTHRIFPKNLKNDFFILI